MATTLHDRLVAFRRKWRGRRINGYSEDGGQCVDEVRQWMAEGFGWSRAKIYAAIPPGDAKTFFSNASSKYFKKVRNTPRGIPPEGSIAVLDHGKHGHVMVVKGGYNTTTRMYTLDQNWSAYHRVADEAHGYAECIGWLIWLGN